MFYILREWNNIFFLFTIQYFSLKRIYIAYFVLVKYQYVVVFEQYYTIQKKNHYLEEVFQK